MVEQIRDFTMYLVSKSDSGSEAAEGDHVRVGPDSSR